MIYSEAIICIFLAFVTVLFVMYAGAAITPISDNGCSNYQSLRSHLDNATAIGCEWNGTAWHFNTSKVKLAFDNDTVYLT